MKEISSQLLIDNKNALGEGPIWHKLRGTLMWVDIEGKMIFECDVKTKLVNSWNIGRMVSLLVETSNADEVILATQGEICKFNLSSSTLLPVVEIEKDNITMRTNDGSVDPLGRVWIGTMELDCKPGAGTLYSISRDNKLTKQIEKTTISNGMVWTQDKKQLYYIDSATSKVRAYMFDATTGKIGYLKDIIQIPESIGVPDGMCQDSNGMLWIGVWGGNGVYCYNPNNGNLLAKINVPAPQVTSCVFGGENNDQLFITTARTGMSEEGLLKFPLSGGVFVAQLEVTGEEKFAFADR